MTKKKIFIAAICSSIMFSMPAFATTTSLKDIQDLPVQKTVKIDPSKSVDPNNWAYKSLVDLSTKYGLLVGYPDKQFHGDKSLSRNEAAVLLVNLLGKVKQDNAKLSESEQTKLDILKNEFDGELAALTERVAVVESNVGSLKASVSKLEAADKQEWKYGFGDQFKIGGLMQMKYNGMINKGPNNTNPNFSIPVSEFRFTGKLQDHITYMASINAHRATSVLGDAYVSTDIVPHHTFYLGQTRTPIGYEGTLSPSAVDTVERAQIARNFSNTRDIGLKAVGNWKYFDYYLGAYNGSGENGADLNRDMAFGGWLVAKPLANMPKLGSLDIGGGYYDGNSDSKATTTSNLKKSQHTYGLYGNYKFKRFGLKGEYARRNITQDLKPTKAASGWYITNTFDLTKKVQLLAKFDTFIDPSSSIFTKRSNEYTLGSNYFFKGNNVKLQLNGVYITNQGGKNAARLGVLTQYGF